MAQPPLMRPATGDGPSRRGRARHHRRRGLAPLELVLWLPVLLFVMALMVNYGTVATWRVRGELVSRHAAWRNRWPRSGATEAAPRRQPYWPADATMTTETDLAFDVLDLPYIDHPVVRGPIPNDFTVLPLLDPTQGAYRGLSSVERPFPLLTRMDGYQSGDVLTPLLDGKWPAAEMGIPNRYRRTKRLYVLPKTAPALPQAFAQAVRGVLTIPHYEALRILDRDADILRYTGSYHDFHPRISWRDMCELDRMTVRQVKVVPLVDIRLPTREIRLGEISRLPRTMTTFFLSMYQRRYQQLLDELNALPPPTPQRRAEILAEMAYLRPRIQQLEAYARRLPQIEADLAARADAALP